jgi:hypothetical protein
MSAPLPPELSASSDLRYVRVARGSIYVDRDVSQLYLPNVDSVAALVREGRAFLLPLHGNGVGGLLLKVRNARGDRVLHAEEFLGTLGIAVNAPERSVVVRWDTAAAGLLLEGLPIDECK